MCLLIPVVIGDINQAVPAVIFVVMLLVLSEDHNLLAAVADHEMFDVATNVTPILVLTPGGKCVPATLRARNNSVICQIVCCETLFRPPIKFLSVFLNLHPTLL